MPIFSIGRNGGGTALTKVPLQLLSKKKKLEINRIYNNFYQ